MNSAKLTEYMLKSYKNRRNPLGNSIEFRLNLGHA